MPTTFHLSSIHDDIDAAYNTGDISTLHMLATAAADALIGVRPAGPDPIAAGTDWGPQFTDHADYLDSQASDQS